MTLSDLRSKELSCHEKTVLIELKGISKSFNGKFALRNVSMQISEGSMFGIIGADGSGKTTLLNIISGAMRFDSGSLEFFDGRNSSRHAGVAYVPQQLALYPELTVDENLKYIAGLHGICGAEFENLLPLYLEKVDLLAHRKKLVKQLSGGMKQKSALAAALLTKAPIILLDEPSTGLDPLSRREFWQLIQSLRRDKRLTIVFSTPLSEEAELCDFIALLSNGTLEASAAPKQFEDELNLKQLDICTSDNQAAYNFILNTKAWSDLIVDAMIVGERLQFILREPFLEAPVLTDFLQKRGIACRALSIARASAENLFYVKMLNNERAPDFATKISSSLQIAASRFDNSVAIRVIELSKNYGKFQAVKNLNLELHYGEIYGLLGANGAGKTSTIQMICGLQKLSSGRILFSRLKELSKNQLAMRIGYMSQKNSLYIDLTTKENLELYAALYQLPGKSRNGRIAALLELLQLENLKDEIVGRLSKGFRQRIALAAALMHEPEILILDEPSSGCDPLARRFLWQLIADFARRGTAILVSSHFIDEAERCHKLGLMKDGELLAEGSPVQLRLAEKAADLEEAFIRLLKRASA
ncbi:MAG: ATP-binding cassette domain-containing protein [Candidatus Obscuribacterales bacterium]|nr:ATP-binding cassette domain-containing protein [Candidatus Obscuribacterales bacterium]